MGPIEDGTAVGTAVKSSSSEIYAEAGRIPARQIIKKGAPMRKIAWGFNRNPPLRLLFGDFLAAQKVTKITYSFTYL